MMAQDASFADSANPQEDSSSNSNSSNEQQSSFRVLGIAMIVDQMGKGPRMVLRYPTTTTFDSEDLFYRLPGRQMAKLFRPKPALCGQPVTLSVGGTVFCCCAVLMEDPNEEQQQQQQQQQQADAATADNQTNKDHLVLFSVVVALAPQVRTSSIPIGSWMEAGSTPDGKQQRQQQPPLGIVEGKLEAPTSCKASATFLSMRRVHVSLARLCRVLEREERRCRYVSVQANLCDQIRQDLSQSGNKKYSYRKAAEETQAQPTKTKTTSAAISTSITTVDTTTTISSNTTSATTAPPLPPPATVPFPGTAISSPGSIVSAKAAQSQIGTTPAVVPPTPLRQHRRAGSFTVSFERDVVPSTKLVTPTEQHRAATEVKYRQEELEQEILETMMTAPPTTTTINDMKFEHQGNLARELVQVYHALARKDHGLTQTPAVLLSGREGIVYMNRHLAVAIEPVTPMRSNADHNQLQAGIHGNRPVIPPYLTLLFPSSSPSELLESMTVTSLSRSVAPRRMQQLLRMVNPQKSLTDISVDASLPLHSTLEIAAYLVGQGACLSSPVLSRKIRLACCQRIGKIRETALAFSQTFGPAVNLFALVSFLTEGSRRTLGDAMSLLTTASASGHFHATWLRQSLNASLPAFGRGDEFDGTTPGALGAAAAASYLPTELYADDSAAGASDLEELLYNMVVWLCAHEVLIQLQDYIVCKFGTAGRDSSSRTINDDDDESTISMHNFDRYPERKSDSNVRLDSLSDDLLYRELVESDCLSGMVSVQACCWKTGIEPMKLYSFVARNETVQLVTRVPAKGDDWGAV